MLGTAKPLASLSSGLLARKGQARPAMRRQGMTSLASLSNAGDDLGWNDMGEGPQDATPAPLPLVLEERQHLAQALAPEPAAIEAPVAITPPPQPQPAAVPTGRKAAFTLRLDAERHLRLRLASAVRGRSAQLLVTEALDALLAAMPDVDALREQLPSTPA